MNIKTNDQTKCILASVGLKNVYDPEIGLNVVDLGLIYELHFNEEALKLVCTMTLTTEFCPMGESITDGVKQSLLGTFFNYDVEVNLTFTPPWSYDCISEEGKEFLNM